uniref:Uncharacterized protein LOC116308589 n=1 Tax=Actinia tenebrosa TaxID=6105 RepID=A0A6P8J4E2_ACTTE
MESGLSDSSQVAATSNATTEKILEGFKTWLQGIDGGRRDLQTSRKYCSQVSAIIRAVDPVQGTVASLLDMKNLRDKWLTPLEKKRKPGTCKSYLGFLSKFLRFLIVENPSEIVQNQEHAQKVKEQVNEWMSSYNGPIAQRRWEKQIEDLEKLITPADIQTFEKSDNARKAVSILGKSIGSTGDVPPTQSECCLVRDFLLTSLSINNACRAGPLSGMTMGELSKAKKEKGSYVVTVFNHKTLKAHGPATVVLSETLNKWVLVFVVHMRNHIPGASRRKDEHVFPSWSGKAMSSSMVSAQINSLWQKCTGNRKERVNAASFRKAAVSVVHENHSHLKGKLADLMSHNQKTAEKFYLIRRKQKNAAKTSESLQDIWKGKSARDTRNGKSCQSITGEANEAESDCKEKGEEMAQENVSAHADLKEGTPTSPVDRHAWTKAEEDELVRVFKKIIEERSISLEETRDRIKDNNILKKIRDTKVRDKVRSLFIKFVGDDNCVQLPSEVET